MSRQALFDLALKAFLFLSPVFFFKDYKLSFAQGLFFVFASFALFGISLALEPKRRFSNYLVALFLLWALIRAFDFGNTAQGWFNFWLSSAGFIYVFAGVLLFYTVYCHAEDPKSYLKPIMIVCIMNAILVIAQLVGHDFMWRHALSIGGFVGISSQLGQYSAMSMPILAFINPWLAVIPLFTLLAAKSVSSILATFAGMAFLCATGYIRKAVGVGMGILLILWLSLNFGYVRAKFQCRPVMWKKTLSAALKRPYLGHGYRSFTGVVVQPGTKGSIGAREYSRAHNDPLHTSQELGFPAMIIIGGFFAGLWRKFKAMQDKDRLACFLMASIVIALTNSCGQTLIRYANVTGTFIVLLALLSIKLEGDKKWRQSIAR